MPSPLERWRELWNGLDARGDPNVPWADLIARYGEPQRAYHTLAHIEAMLEEFDDFRVHGGEDCDGVELAVVETAIWYHDAVYDSRAKDNEERSASLFRKVAESSKLPESFTGKVADAILATKHGGAEAGREACIVCDIDLAILGQPEAVFDDYERRIREEYEWVPENQFRAGRGAVLQAFCERPYIYSTRFFREKYEGRARKNLLRSIRRSGNSVIE